CEATGPAIMRQSRCRPWSRVALSHRVSAARAPRAPSHGALRRAVRGRVRRLLYDLTSRYVEGAAPNKSDDAPWRSLPRCRAGHYLADDGRPGNLAPTRDAAHTRAAAAARSAR